MKTRTVFAWACALAVAGVVSAQEPWSGHKLRPPGEAQVAVAPVKGEWVAKDRVIDWPNPVPTRIESTHYGVGLNNTGLDIDCFIWGEDTSMIRVTGGKPEAPAVLFCAVEPAEIKLPWGMVLVSPECVAIPGWFDRDGCFDMPVNLGRRELCGQTFYFQALELPRGADIPRLSWGFKVRYARGNAQPADVLRIEPAMQAILCKSVSPLIPTLYNVLIRFEAAESHVLSVEDVYQEEGKTLVYVSLLSPGGPWGANRWHRAVADLGPFPQPEVEVWVTVNHGGPCLLSKLGAVVKTEF
jgi:hypothetical protein